MENNFDSNVISHSVKVLERSNIFISGTKKVHNFNENEFLINTVMGNINSIGVAVLAELSCISLTENAPLDEDAKTRAEENGVVVLTTAENAYETAARISKLI